MHYAILTNNLQYLQTICSTYKQFAVLTNNLPGRYLQLGPQSTAQFQSHLPSPETLVQKCPSRQTTNQTNINQVPTTYLAKYPGKFLAKDLHISEFLIFSPRYFQTFKGTLKKGCSDRGPLIYSEFSHFRLLGKELGNSH